MKKWCHFYNVTKHRHSKLLFKVAFKWFHLVLSGHKHKLLGSLKHPVSLQAWLIFSTWQRKMLKSAQIETIQLAIIAWISRAKHKKKQIGIPTFFPKPWMQQGLLLSLMENFKRLYKSHPNKKKAGKSTESYIFLSLPKAKISEKLSVLSSKGKMGHKNCFTFD